MIIKKFKNGNILFKMSNREREDFFEINLNGETFDLFYNHEDLFFSDLYFMLDDSCNLWLFDRDKGLAYAVADLFNTSIWYRYNFFSDLLQGKDVLLSPYGTIEEIEKEFFLR